MDHERLDGPSLSVEASAADIDIVVRALEAPSPLPTPSTGLRPPRLLSPGDGARMLDRIAFDEPGAVERDDEWCVAFAPT